MQLDFSNKPLVKAAFNLADVSHVGQKRKYTGEYYLTHPIEVAEILLRHGISDQISLATALLHDVLEDTATSVAKMESVVGSKVTRYVQFLTDVEVGNRAQRKAAALTRICSAPVEVQNVKIADMISNTRSIVEHDPKFAAVYLEEKVALLRAMDSRCCESLMNEAYSIYSAGLTTLAMTQLTTGLATQAKDAADDVLIDQILHQEAMRSMAENALF